MLRLGNAYLEFFEYVQPAGWPKDPNYGANDHGYTHFCLDVQDIDAEYERLQQQGVTLNCPPPDFPGPFRATCGRDPDDNVIELQQISDPQPATRLRTRQNRHTAVMTGASNNSRSKKQLRQEPIEDALEGRLTAAAIQTSYTGWFKPTSAAVDPAVLIYASLGFS